MLLPILSRLLFFLAAAGVITYSVSQEAGTTPLPSFFQNLISPQSTTAPRPTESVADEILVKFKTGVDEAGKGSVRSALGLSKKDEIAQIGVELDKVPQAAKDRVLAALQKNPRVEYAEPNYQRKAQITPNDPGYPNQWAPKKISAPSGWDISTGDSSVRIAVLDTGIDGTHEDLVSKIIGVPSQDDNGHGTQVAGIAAASSNNAKGVASVCWSCSILSIKVLNSAGSGSDSTVAKGIIAAADAGAKAINLSLGAYISSSTEKDAVNYAWTKGAVIIGASGNDNTSTKFYPAAYQNVIATGATCSGDTKSSVSNYGAWLDVVAPGCGISTTKLGGSYTVPSGTSMSAPHVAGLAGLIFSANPGLTNQQVVDIITSTADKVGGVTYDSSGFNIYYGYGRINVAAALAKAVGTAPPPTDATAPSVTFSSPSSGATISSLTDVAVNASDNVAVTKVEFYVDGILKGTVTSSPYLLLLDTTKLSNAEHTLTSKAYDAAGNSSTASETVNVSNISPPASSDTTSPTVSITAPTDGSVVSAPSKTAINASATDNVGVTKVEFYVNGSLKCTDAAASYTCSWSVPGKKNVTYTLVVKAYDAAGNTSSASITVTAK